MATGKEFAGYLLALPIGIAVGWAVGTTLGGSIPDAWTWPVIAAWLSAPENWAPVLTAVAAAIATFYGLWRQQPDGLHVAHSMDDDPQLTIRARAVRFRLRAVRRKLGATAYAKEANQASSASVSLSGRASEDIANIHAGTLRGVEAQNLDKDAPGIDLGPDQTVSLLFKTTRQATTSKRGYFSGERDEDSAHYGMATVRIPDRRRPGDEVKLPFKFEAFGITFIQKKSDPKRHFILKGVEDMPLEEWTATVRAASSREALVFVHGFSVKFLAAVYRAAQIFWDLRYEGVPILYSWASRGHKRDYGYDRNSALTDREAFAELLVTLRDAGIEKVHVLAHSMGNFCVLDALAYHDHKSQPLSIGEVVMAAPDVDASHYKKVAVRVRRHSTGMTLYASAADRALMLSKAAAGGIIRAGDLFNGSPLLIDRIDSIDATSLGDEIFGLNHGDYASDTSILNDVRLLISQGLRPPHARLVQLLGIPDRKAPKWWRYI